MKRIADLHFGKRRRGFVGESKTGCRFSRALFVSICVVIHLPAHGAEGDSPPGPSIHVDKDLFDLGRVRDGTIGEVVFSVENRGTAPLEIIDAKTTCTCLHFELPRRVVAPGGRIFIPAKYVTTGHQGRESGAITLTTNDVNTPRTRLVITVDIDALYEMEPLGRLTLQPQRGGLPCEPPLTLLPVAMGTPLTVVDARAQNKSIEVQVRPFGRDGRAGAQLVVQAPENVRAGTLRDALLIEIAVGPEHRKLRIPVELPILGEIRCEPRIMARLNAGWRARRIGVITVESVLGSPLELVDVRAEGPIEITVAPNRSQPGHEIQVSISEDAPTGPFGALVTILTDEHTEPLITVPIFGNVQPWVWIDPPEVFLAGRPHHTVVEPATVKLMWPTSAPVRMSNLTCDDARVRVELIPGPTEILAGQEMSSAQIRIKIAEGLVPGRFSTVIRIETGWERQPRVEVPVFVRVE